MRGRAQAELPGARDASAQLREVDRHEDERDVLHDRVGDLQAGGDVRGGDVDPERQRRADRRSGHRSPPAPTRRRAPPEPSTAASRASGAPAGAAPPRAPARTNRPAAGWLAGSRGRLEARHRFSLRGRVRGSRHPMPGRELSHEERHQQAETPVSPGTRARGCAASHAASQMLSGNSTTRKRGSDISGCEVTG